MDRETLEKAKNIRTLGQVSRISAARTAPVATRRVGSIDGPMYGSFTPVFEDGGPDSTYFSHPYRNSWISMIVEYRGKFYWVERTSDPFNPEREQRYAYVAAPEGAFYVPNPDLAVIKSGFRLNFTWDAKQGLKYVCTDPRGPCEITITDKTFAWKEQGAFELEGRIAGPGLMMMFPVRKDGQAGIQLYFHEQFMVEGNVRGEPVKGFILYEHHYGPVPWRDGTFYGGNGGFLVFGNEFDDGSTELGLIHCDETMRGGVIVNGKGDELINTQVVNVVNTVSDEAALTEAVYTLGGDAQFKFQVHQGAAVDYYTAVGLAKDYPKTASWGLVTRAGETRKRVRGWANAQAGRM